MRAKLSVAIAQMESDFVKSRKDLTEVQIGPSTWRRLHRCLSNRRSMIGLLCDMQDVLREVCKKNVKCVT